jgi:hypothetical protein
MQYGDINTPTNSVGNIVSHSTIKDMANVKLQGYI